MPGRRTSIAARASSRWTESDRAALERARTRVHARYVAEGANSRLATSRDRTDGASPSSRAPTIFRHTVREAFGEWLPERRALSRARENGPPANATRDRSRSGPATTAPDVSVATLTSGAVVAGPERDRSRVAFAGGPFSLARESARRSGSHSPNASRTVCRKIVGARDDGDAPSVRSREVARREFAPSATYRACTRVRARSSAARSDSVHRDDARAAMLVRRPGIFANEPIRRRSVSRTARRRVCDARGN